MKKINTDLPLDIYQPNVTLLIDLIDEQLEEIEGAEAELSWNSFGGSVYAGQRFADYLNGTKFNLTANVSGIAASMGAVLLPFFKKVIGSKQSDIMLHASYGGVESTAKNTNEFLYAALAKKVDEKKFKEVTGKNLKDVMLAQQENRVDVWLTGEQAGYIGLFDETYDLLDKAATFSKVNLTDIGYELPEKVRNKFALKTINNNEMEIKDLTVDLLKQGNPTVYEAICKEAKQEEQKRVEGIMKYAKFDIDKANELVKTGVALSVEHVEYFMEKKFSNAIVAELETNSEGELTPGKVATKEEKSTEAKEKEAALNDFNEKIGLGEFKIK
jgi:ATP-dependent protease ClpP protease subunit